MRFPILSTQYHQGKTLEIDCDRETVALYDHGGHHIGTLTWAWVIDRILSAQDGDEYAHARAYPRAPLAIKVHCVTSEGKEFESLTGGIGGGGLFIESGSPLQPGSELTVEFTLPDHPSEKIAAQGRVVWRRTKTERLLLFPGMDIQFTDIAPEARERIVHLVESLNRSRISN